MNSPSALLEVDDLKVHYPPRPGSRQVVRAVDGVSLQLEAGGTLGLVGESGCGKSTLGRAVLRLVEATSGSIRFAGNELTGMPCAQLCALRPRVQLVFQDAGASLNPRWSVRRIVGEPLQVHRRAEGQDLQSRVDALLEDVGLDASLSRRRPRELSGGQQQRVGIARAIALDPDLLICDEPTSALDLSTQARIIDLLRDLQRRRRMAYLFIGHDLGVIRQVCGRVAVMYLGRIVEQGPVGAVFDTPAHPYTRALLAAAPVGDPRRAREQTVGLLRGETPDASGAIQGCSFCPRCPEVERVHEDHGIDCAELDPRLRPTTSTRVVACHLYEPEQPLIRAREP